MGRWKSLQTCPTDKSEHVQNRLPEFLTNFRMFVSYLIKTENVKNQQISIFQIICLKQGNTNSTSLSKVFLKIHPGRRNIFSYVSSIPREYEAIVSGEKVKRLKEKGITTCQKHVCRKSAKIIFLEKTHHYELNKSNLSIGSDS